MPAFRTVLKSLAAAAALLAASACATVSAPPRSTPGSATSSPQFGAGPPGPEIATTEAGVMASFRFALESICAPYVQQGATMDAVLNRPSVYPAPSLPMAQPGTRTVFAASRAVTVMVDPVADGGGSCTIFIQAGSPIPAPDPAALRSALTAWVARQSPPLTSSAIRMDPGRYVFRDLWCSPAGAPQVSVLASTDGRNQAGQGAAIAVSLLKRNQRDSRC